MPTSVTQAGARPAGNFLVERRRELILVGTAFALAFALVSLAGANADDPTAFRPGTGRVENPCGPVGAHVAHVLRASLGVGAWSSVVGLSATLVALAGRPLGKWTRWLGAGVAGLSTLGLLTLWVPELDSYPSGGWVGAALAGGLEEAAGRVGAALLLAGSALIGLTALFEVHWKDVALRLVEGVERQAPVVGAAAATAGRRGAGVVARGAVRGAAGSWRGLRSSVRGVARLVRRIRSSVRRGTQGEAYDLEELDEAFDPSSFGGDPHEVDRTALGRLDAVAEVEWEPTQHVDPPRADVEIVGPTPTPTVAIRQVGPVPTGAPPVVDLFPELAPRAGARKAARPAPVVVTHLPTSSASTAAAPVAVATPRPASARPAALEPSVPTAVPSVVEEPDDDDVMFDESEVGPPSTGGTARAGAVRVHRAAFLDEAPPADDGRAIVVNRTFELPPLGLLDEVPEQHAVVDETALREMAAIVEEKLLTFKIGGSVTAVRPGPVVTTFEFEPAPGVKVSRISALEDDLAMALRAVRVRIVAPIPGKGCVGIEIPSAKRLTIYLREVLASGMFRESKAALPCVLGKDVEGRPVVADLATTPHLLIGGTTGSGKSVGVNGILMSLLFSRSPKDLRMLLVDPKMLEFELYEGIPHLLHPVVTDPAKAAAALAWACREMDRRYELLARWGVRNIIGFNTKLEREAKDWSVAKARQYAPKDWFEGDGLPDPPAHMPYIVVVIDELADLMMVASKEVEESIARIAQKARACGIHLVVATQRPSVDVVTGLIKANLPTRISFQLRTGTDSRTVLDSTGAEALLGRGDMLFLPPGIGNLQRVHGAFVSDDEVSRVMGFLRTQAEPDYIAEITATESDGAELDESERDELYDAALEVVQREGKASTSMIQRHLKIGYNRAARIIDFMEAAGVVGPADGARPRELLL
jgi:hypothetical protein